jgi:hypothetical protein
MPNEATMQEENSLKLPTKQKKKTRLSHGCALSSLRGRKVEIADSGTSFIREKTMKVYKRK